METCMHTCIICNLPCFENAFGVPVHDDHYAARQNLFGVAIAQ